MPSDCSTVSVNIPLNFRGKLIGKGGSMLENLRSVYGVGINVPKRKDRPIQVKGKKEKVSTLVSHLCSSYGGRVVEGPKVKK